MYILLIIQHSRAVDGGDTDLVPLNVVHVILVDPELGAGEGNACHLILKRGDVEGSGYHMVKEQLKTVTVEFGYKNLRFLKRSACPF